MKKFKKIIITIGIFTTLFPAIWGENVSETKLIYLPPTTHQVQK